MGTSSKFSGADWFIVSMIAGSIALAVAVTLRELKGKEYAPVPAAPVESPKPAPGVLAIGPDGPVIAEEDEPDCYANRHADRAFVRERELQSKPFDWLEFYRVRGYLNSPFWEQFETK